MGDASERGGVDYNVVIGVDGETEIDVDERRSLKRSVSSVQGQKSCEVCSKGKHQ